MFLHELIDRLLRCERRIHHIYEALGERDGYCAEMRAFWQEMAEDENSHREFLERTAGLLNFMESPPDMVETALANVEAKLIAAETAVKQPDLSPDNALRHALHIENSELRSINEGWIEGFRPSLTLLMHAQFPDEEAHLRRLVDAVERFSTDAALHERAELLWVTYQQQKSDCVT